MPVQISWNSSAQGQDGITEIQELISSAGNENTNTLYIRNNSNSSAYEFGIYISPSSYFHIDEDMDADSIDHERFELLMRWAQEEHDSLPCGFFTIFGRDESEESYISKYLNETITAEELLTFQHNWLQGRSWDNAIQLDVVDRELPSGATDLSSLNPEEEIQILNVIRIPSDAAATKININLKAFFIENL